MRSTSGRSTSRASTARRSTMAGWRGRPLLLNFWATWCAPCVVEMPLLDRFAREQRPSGWRVLALAVDQPDPVRRFVAERNARRCRWRLAARSASTCRARLGNVGGGLPFTAAFDSTGAAVQRRLGAVERRTCWPAGGSTVRTSGSSPLICRQLAANGDKSPRIAGFCGSERAACSRRCDRGRPMDLRKLKTLIDLVSESNISELEIAEADGKVRIVKTPSAQRCRAGRARRSHAALAVAPAPAERGAGGCCAAAAPTGNVVKSPMVGTFYRSASPGSDAVRRDRQRRSRSASRSASSRR